MYLQNMVLNVDGVNCAIYMMPADVTYETNLFFRGELTRQGRAKFTVPDFPLGAEAFMRTKCQRMYPNDDAPGLVQIVAENLFF
jgi:hypothetical protein